MIRLRKKSVVGLPIGEETIYRKIKNYRIRLTPEGFDIVVICEKVGRKHSERRWAVKKGS